MKKITYRSLIFLFITLTAFIIYLSIIGIKTDKFNNQISKELKKKYPNLELSLDKINIVLDPFNFQLNLKTIGASLKSKNKKISLESIKSNIHIRTFFNNEFSLTELDISTRSLEIKNLISFIRMIQDNTQLFILEKFIKKGYLIADINLKFDKNGKINNDFFIKGSIKDAEIKPIKKFNFSKINFNFNIDNKIYDFKDVKLSLNNTNLVFPTINIKREKNKFSINGKNQNKNISLNENQIIQFFENDFSLFKINNSKFDLENIFSFTIDKKYKVENFQINSDLILKEMNLSNKVNLKKYLPKAKDFLRLTNHKVKIEIKKNYFSLKGNGKILLQEKLDDIEYEIIKSKKDVKFNGLIRTGKNPFNIDFLNFKKNENSKLDISFKGKKDLILNKILFKDISLEENDNLIKASNLDLSKDNKIMSVDKIILDYSDKDLLKNKIIIDRNNENYNLYSSSFNAINLINDLLDTDYKSKIKKIFHNDFKVIIKVDKTHLDKEYVINNLIGYLVFSDSEIKDADLEAFFSNSKKIRLTIRSTIDEKITTLYSDIAKPFVNRYEFIKGFDQGNLDFYSIKKNNLSNSKLIIDNFKVQEVPALAKLLTLASLQGIADLLTGEGIRFSDFEMNFSNEKNLMKINELYAIGPAISILMDGYIEGKNLISLRGTMVPATTINRTISSIPLIGNILVGKKVGEGVFGVSFKVKGPPKKLKTTVNPVKTLTPRFITRTLEKLKDN